MATILMNPPLSASRLQEIARQAYQQYVVAIGKEPAPMVADYQAHIDEDIIFTIEEADEVIGFAIIIEKADGFWLETIAVADGYRGQGYGTKLLAHSEAYLRAHASSYQLYTNEKMTQNKDWYLRLGFTITAIKSDEGYRRIFFKKEL